MVLPAPEPHIRTHYICTLPCGVCV